MLLLQLLAVLCLFFVQDISTTLASSSEILASDWTTSMTSSSITSQAVSSTLSQLNSNSESTMATPTPLFSPNSPLNLPFLDPNNPDPALLKSGICDGKFDATTIFNGWLKIVNTLSTIMVKAGCISQTSLIVNSTNANANSAYLPLMDPGNFPACTDCTSGPNEKYSPCTFIQAMNREVTWLLKQATECKLDLVRLKRISVASARAIANYQACLLVQKSKCGTTSLIATSTSSSTSWSSTATFSSTSTAAAYSDLIRKSSETEWRRAGQWNDLGQWSWSDRTWWMYNFVYWKGEWWYAPRIAPAVNYSQGQIVDNWNWNWAMQKKWNTTLNGVSDNGGSESGIPPPLGPGYNGYHPIRNLINSIPNNSNVSPSSLPGAPTPNNSGSGSSQEQNGPNATPNDAQNSSSTSSNNSGAPPPAVSPSASNNPPSSYNYSPHNGSSGNYYPANLSQSQMTNYYRPWYLRWWWSEHDSYLPPNNVPSLPPLTTAIIQTPSLMVAPPKLQPQMVINPVIVAQPSIPATKLAPIIPPSLIPVVQIPNIGNFKDTLSDGLYQDTG